MTGRRRGSEAVTFGLGVVVLVGSLIERRFPPNSNAPIFIALGCGVVVTLLISYIERRRKKTPR